MSVVGVTRNPYETKVPVRLLTAASELGMQTRVIDLPSVRAQVAPDGRASAADRSGPILVDALTPFLLYGFPAASHAFTILARTARTQNPVGSVLLADDKAATAVRLAAAGVPQVPTEVVPLDPDQVAAAATRLGYPVVVKRTHGAQGRWVRRAPDRARLATAVDELTVEGLGALVVQPEVLECAGRSIRALVTGGRLVVATERVAGGDEWKSNVAQGASQQRIELTEEERLLVDRAMDGLELRHAGIDMLRTAHGPRVLEVNACPAFTSMQPHCEVDLARAVLLASTTQERSSAALGEASARSAERGHRRP